MLVERKEHKEEDGSLGYVESVFKSSNILKTTYFPKYNRLYIAFSRGDTYSYGNISEELYEEFESSESHGKFFYKNINNNSKYPHRREYTLYPREVEDVKKIIEENTNNEDNE
ncbi:MAG: KTSC domain-containing protein [bacterium]